MISEFVSSVLLVPAVVGLRLWWVWFSNRGNSQGEPQSPGRHEGSLADSFFDPRAADCPQECKSTPLDAHRNPYEFRS